MPQARGAEHAAEDGGKHVRVLVGVDVGELEAFVLEELDLGAGFGLDFSQPDAPGEQARQECYEC